jgi:hypothetical protein
MTKLIINCETNEIIERELTTAELKQQEKDEKLVNARLAEIQAKAEAKAALLVKLGITEDEAKLLLA